MAEKYVVRLTAEEREELTTLTSKGQASAAKIRHAQVLLKADADGPNWPDARIADAFSIHLNTVAGIRKRLVRQGLEAALNRQPQARPSRGPKLDGAGKARLLADRWVELGIVERFSHESVRRVLKKTNSSPIGVSRG